MKLSNFQSWFGALLSLGVVTLAASATRADEGADWKTFNALEAQLKDASDTEPDKAIDAYQKFYNARPKLNPIVGSTLALRVARLQTEKLQQPQKALETYEWSLKTYGAQPAGVVLLEGNAKALIAADRAADAQQLIEKHWPQLVQAGQTRHPYLTMFTSRALMQLVEALDKQKKSEQAVPILQKAVLEIPVFLDDRKQGVDGWKDGWMWQSIVDRLKADKPDIAMQWAKLAFLTCAFDKGSISRSTQLLAGLWADREAFADIQAFSVAQDDATRANPLAKVSLPNMDAPLVQAQMKRLRPAANAKFIKEHAPEIIGLLIASGATREAMSEAQQLVKAAPADPEGAGQICRVLKAHDNSIRRANLFVQYLEGKAPNPLPEFSKEASNPPAPVAAAKAAPVGAKSEAPDALPQAP